MGVGADEQQFGVHHSRPSAQSAITPLEGTDTFAHHRHPAQEPEPMDMGDQVCELAMTPVPKGVVVEFKGHGGKP